METIIYQNKYFKQFTDVLLEIAKWSPELWWKICIVFKKIGRYSLRNTYIQLALMNKFSLSRGLVVDHDYHNTYKMEYFTLPDKTRHGEFKYTNTRSEICSICKYNNGRIEGEYIERDNNSGSIIKFYKNGYQHGEYKEVKYYNSKNLNDKKRIAISFFQIFGLNHGLFDKCQYGRYSVKYVSEKIFYNLGDRVEFILQIQPIKYPEIITDMCEQAFIWSIKYFDGVNDQYFNVDNHKVVVKDKQTEIEYNFYIAPNNLKLCGSIHNYKLQRLIKQYETYKFKEK
jgi:hypothetical protein